MREVPIFIFNGLLESGKTKMIKTLLRNPQMTNGRVILLILCEEGEEEYDEKALRDKNVSIVTLDSEADFNEKKLRALDREYVPDYVVIEYNGMWDKSGYLSVDYPGEWGIAQIMTTVDSTTFGIYRSNMRDRFAAMFGAADTVVFNRFDDKYGKGDFYRSVIARNMRAKVIFEYADGSVDTDFDESPFDLSGDTLELPDDDFALWYFDVMDHVDRYEGKTVKFRAMLSKFEDKKYPGFMVGRLAMTCCEADIRLLGIYCPHDETDMPDGAYVYVTAKVVAADSSLYGEDSDQQLPILEIVTMNPSSAPINEVLSL